tara:strand:- start:159 stop:386 length:228 start_codon:yes stop_codon:yes gene_type:complete
MREESITSKEQRHLRIEQKLDAILEALSYSVGSCPHCDDGIRVCGFRNDPDRIICYECKGSAIKIDKAANNPFGV